MDVLDPQQHRAVGAQRPDQLEERVEEALGVAALAVGCRRGLAELGHQPRELGAAHVGELGEDRVAARTSGAQGRDEGRVGKLVVAELDAAAAERAHALLVGAGDQLGEQARLADPRLAGHEGERRQLRAVAVDRSDELGELIAAADEAACGDARRHRLSMPRAALAGGKG